MKSETIVPDFFELQPHSFLCPKGGLVHIRLEGVLIVNGDHVFFLNFKQGTTNIAQKTFPFLLSWHVTFIDETERNYPT